MRGGCETMNISETLHRCTAGCCISCSQPCTPFQKMSALLGWLPCLVTASAALLCALSNVSVCPATYPAPDQGPAPPSAQESGCWQSHAQSAPGTHCPVAAPQQAMPLCGTVRQPLADVKLIRHAPEHAKVATCMAWHLLLSLGELQRCLWLRGAWSCKQQRDH